MVDHRAAAAIAALIVFALGASTASAQPKFVAKVTSSAQADHPTVLGIKRIADIVREKTRGEVEIQAFPSSQLGGEAESLEGMKLGSIQGGLITSSLFTQWVPEFEIIDLPFVFRDDEHAQAACNRLFQSALAPKLVAHGFRSAGCFNFGGRDLISTFPITSVANVQGRRMRVIQSPTFLKIWQAVGANPVAIPAPEIYTALQTKVVDFLDNPKTNYLTFKWYEVAKHFTPLGYVNSIQFLTFSEQWMRGLPPEHQKAIVDASAEVLPKVSLELRETDAKNLSRTVELGSSVHQITDRPEWQKRMAPIWDAYRAKVPDGAKIIDAVVDLR
jgi:TRAP-type transport system periplasmic protein